MASVPFVVRVTGLNEAKHFLRTIARGGLTLSHQQAAQEVAGMVGKAVRQRYITASTPGHARGTSQVYSQGKLASAGAYPWNRYRPVRGGHVRPYIRSMQLANSVIVSPLGYGKQAYGYRVQIDPKKAYKGGGADPADTGKPLAAIAHALEYPKPVVVRRTLRMMAYLRLLEEGRAGRPSAAKRPRGPLPDVTLPGTLTIMHTARRPVWQWVAKRIMKFRGPYGRMLQKHIKLNLLSAPGVSYAKRP